MPDAERERYVQAFRATVPSLESNHKGQHGRVGVVGGCVEYTGAPFYAAMSALRVGADLAHVFCASDAATAIKSYSPELIVHPVLDRANAADYVGQWIERLHVLVIGPGLGRNAALGHVLVSIVEKAKARQIPLVFDADGLHFITRNIGLVSGYEPAILTPNAVEFDRLYAAAFTSSAAASHAASVAERSVELARRLGNVTLLVKGATDYVTNGSASVVGSEPGSGRRCGGQGDILSGVVGTFASWGRAKAADNWTLAACLAASILTRSCNLLAFRAHGRSALTSDMVKFIGKSFQAHFER